MNKRVNWRDAYEERLRNFKIVEALAIARRALPEKLYRYIKFDEKGHWRRSLFESELFMNLPSYFYDPIDSRWFLDYEKHIAERFHNENIDEPDIELLKLMIPLYEEDCGLLISKNS